MSSSSTNKTRSAPLSNCFFALMYASRFSSESAPVSSTAAMDLIMASSPATSSFLLGNQTSFDDPVDIWRSDFSTGVAVAGPSGAATSL